MVFFKVNFWNSLFNFWWHSAKAVEKNKSMWCRSGVFVVKFENISHLILVFLLLTLSWQLPAGKASHVLLKAMTKIHTLIKGRILMLTKNFCLTDLIFLQVFYHINPLLKPLYDGCINNKKNWKNMEGTYGR